MTVWNVMFGRGLMVEASPSWYCVVWSQRYHKRCQAGIGSCSSGSATYYTSAAAVCSFFTYLKAQGIIRYSEIKLFLCLLADVSTPIIMQMRDQWGICKQLPAEHHKQHLQQNSKLEVLFSLFTTYQREEFGMVREFTVTFFFLHET